MTFKELLNQCRWEDLEDFLYEFPDVGMDEGRWKMEGFRRMYDELRRMTPQASEQKIQLRKPKEKGCDYPALFTRPAANSGYLSACSWAEYLGQEVVPPKGMKLPPAALVAACMCGMSEFGYTDQECEEAYKRLAEHYAEDSVVKYDLDMDIYDNPTRPIKKWLMRRIRDYHTGFDIPAWDELPTQSRICHISFSHYSWDDAQDGGSETTGDDSEATLRIPKVLDSCGLYRPCLMGRRSAVSSELDRDAPASTGRDTLPRSGKPE